MSLLQLFLGLNLIAIGILATVAVQQARAHFKPVKMPESVMPGSEEIHLPSAVKDRILEAAQANFQLALKRSADDFEQNLVATGARLNQTLEKLGTETVGNEASRHEAELKQIHLQMEAALKAVPDQISSQKAELAKALEQATIAERDKLVKQMETKLADAVAAFLVETLGHNVDLGAQNAYLISVLDEHKSDLIATLGAAAPLQAADQTQKTLPAQPSAPAATSTPNTAPTMPSAPGTAQKEQA